MGGASTICHRATAGGGRGCGVVHVEEENEPWELNLLKAYCDSISKAAEWGYSFIHTCMHTYIQSSNSRGSLLLDNLMNREDSAAVHQGYPRSQAPPQLFVAFCTKNGYSMRQNAGEEPGNEAASR